ncbi:hypothetical protein H6G32_17525 [Cylindrospermum sp. FACHB-282]|nr:hypothetical protein [Cylindrospermum sp. FACHB-282]
MAFNNFLPGTILEGFNFQKIIKTLDYRKKQDITLKADVDTVLAYKAWIKDKTNNTLDKTRILGVVSVSSGSEKYLPYTIPKIIKQVSEIGLMADIVIGLNNGFECQTVIDRLSFLPDVQVIHLYTGEKVANNVPAKIFDTLRCEGEPYYLRNIDFQQCSHRIFIIHQQEGIYSAGKIRMLGDIYSSLLLESIDKGWIPPEILVAFDAESQFLVEQNYPAIELDSNGLMLIVTELQNKPEIDILGTRTRLAVYQKTMLDDLEILLPNFRQEIPPIQWFIEIMHGKFRGYKWNAGGGIVARTNVMISLLAVIAEMYPGTRIEDVHLTILAMHSGFIGDIFMDVVSTNRTPSITDMTMDQPPKKAWIEQIYRWNAGYQGLKLCYGLHNIKLIASDGFPWFSLREPIKFLQSVKGKEAINLSTVIKKIKYLAIALLASQQIRKRSIENPDILQGSGAKGFW